MASSPSLKTRALQALARREHSRAELRARLETHADTPEELDGLLDELEKRGWLSEQRFVEQLTTVRRRKFGADRIVRELREKGVSGEALEASRAALQAGEIDAARAVWKKKFGYLPGTLQEKARQQRFMAGRGFSAEAVRTVLKESRDD
ncbi:MAG: recombination regulator RecX [Burkholderiales bacterium]